MEYSWEATVVKKGTYGLRRSSLSVSPGEIEANKKIHLLESSVAVLMRYGDTF